MIEFRYSAELLARFPSIHGGMIIAQNVQNGTTPSTLLAQFEAEQKAVLERIGDRSLADLESISAWRRAFSAFGVKPTQYRCAAEALLRRLTKQGDIPSINMLVDIGNMISIRYGIPIAMCDTAAIKNKITARFATGTETFNDLGSSESVHPEVGEVIFVDDKGMVIARRWCWRQSAESASSESTTGLLVTIEGHHANAQADVQAALQDIQALLTQYAGGTMQSALLSVDNPALTIKA